MNNFFYERRILRGKQVRETEEFSGRMVEDEAFRDRMLAYGLKELEMEKQYRADMKEIAAEANTRRQQEYHDIMAEFARRKAAQVEEEKAAEEKMEASRLYHEKMQKEEDKRTEEDRERDLRNAEHKAQKKEEEKAMKRAKGLDSDEYADVFYSSTPEEEARREKGVEGKMAEERRN